MGRIDSHIPEKDLALDYNSAKIIASPYNYKLSERIMFYDRDICSRHFNIFLKANDAEEYLCRALGLKPIKYMGVNPTLSIDGKAVAAMKASEIGDALWQCESKVGMEGTLIKYNNLVVDEDSLLEDMEPITTKVEALRDKSYLKALEVWHLMGTDASSIIPNLMYLATEFHDRPLDQLENITFAEEALSRKEAPLMEGFRFPHSEDDPLEINTLLDAAAVPFIPSSDVGKYWLGKVDNSLFILGLTYSIAYGTELLYCLDNIRNDVIRNALEELLSVNYREGSFCSEFLYSFDDRGHIEANPSVRACFSKSNETRFENIREMVSRMVKRPEFSGDVYSKLNYYGLPTFFAKMVISMHAYAYQVCRVKHATLVYKEAKEAGVINRDTFNQTVAEFPGIFGEDFKDSEGHSDGLLNLDSLIAPDEGKPSIEEGVEKEKEVHKKDEFTAPALNAADVLKKDLYDSRYDFDINYVKNDVNDKDAYNVISSGIKLITNELTRQIKDIKTYNTGGKQGGLLVGKLDKKNLWKYKSDPHIFYNNNYKLKEMDLAFGCILDESGSMHGEKIKNGRIVMIMLHEVLNSLGINHSIIGHTSSGMYQSRIFKYFQFREEPHYSLDKPYGLVRADNRSGNCDSGALFYMQSVMKGVRNKDKIVIIFSDGQPTECTDLDLTNQVKAMEKAGIHVIGVGINFESIKEYYPDNANGRNLKEMVDIVVSILKRYVLEKKED